MENIIEKNINYKLNICLIMPCSLPVPAVKGGAIETLAELLAQYNEKLNMCNLTIVSIYDIEAVSMEYNYPNVEWIHIHKNMMLKYSDYFFRLVRKITKKSFRISLYDYVVLNEIKNRKFDRIIFEGGNEFFLKKYTKYFDKNILYYHFHSIYRPSYDISTYIGNTITISEYLNKEFLKKSSFEYKRAKVVLNGIEISKFSKKIDEQEKLQLRQKYNLNDNDFILIYVGRLIPEKGIKELIDAMNLLTDKSIKLLVVGNGTGFNNNFMENVIDNIKKNDCVKYVGYIPNDELYKYYKISDCFIMPSICEEGAGLVQTEAYAAGIPSIVSNMGGISEYRIKEASIVVNNDEEFVSNLANAINQMKSKLELGYIYENYIKSQVNFFSAENYYINYMKIMMNID